MKHKKAGSSNKWQMNVNYIIDVYVIAIFLEVKSTSFGDDGKITISTYIALALADLFIHTHLFYNAFGVWRTTKIHVFLFGAPGGHFTITITKTVARWHHRLWMNQSYLVRRCHVGPQNDTPHILNVSLDVFQGCQAHDWKCSPLFGRTVINITSRNCHYRLCPSHSSESSSIKWCESECWS